jgi:hypothetical protein
MASAPSATRSALRRPACRILSLPLLLLAAPVAAQVLVNGDEFQVNTYTPDYQSEGVVAFGADGSFVVVWDSYGSSGPDQDGWGIVARRFDARGVPLGGEFQVNSYTTGRQVLPRVAADAQGSFVVVWESYGSPGDDSWWYSIQARRFDAAGVPLGPQFQVNTYTTDSQSRPDVAALSPQGFVVIWGSQGSADGDSSATSVHARRYDADGAPLGDQFRVNTLTTGIQDYAVVAAAPQGGFAAAWHSGSSAGTDTSSRSVQARLFDAEGDPAGSEVQVNAYTSLTQARPSISAGPLGGFVVAWESNGSYGDDASLGSVQLRRFDSALSPLGGQLQVNVNTPGDQWSPSVTTDPAGDFLVAWKDYDRIVARRYAPDGTPKSSEVQINVAGDVFPPEVVADARGNFVVVWSSGYSGYPNPDSEVTARRIDGLFRDGVESGDTARWSTSQP